jgi:S1-C subfamily serine protease
VERESPARKAGLAARDILVTFDDQSVSDLDALQWKIAAVEEPTKVRIVFLRNGETKTVETQIEVDPQK